MQKLPGRFLSLIIVPLFASLAHGAVITGTVYDATNNIFLEGARVVIQDTGQSAISERGGRFRISGVEPGAYVLAANATGYPTVRQEVTVADAFDEIRVNFEYTADEVYELEAFVVEGTLIGAAKGMDIRRTATDLREVIASDAFGQFTDRNPAEALQRVAGIAVQGDQGEGKFIVVRGMAPEFSAVQIDGIGLATPEDDGRRVNLNVITVDQVERIEASKTWVPSQKGNVIGATVNIITRSALDRGERFASAEYAGTKRENQKSLMSWRGAFTMGEIIDNRKASWLGDKAIGLQFSINQSDDYSGSDTVSWGWHTRKQWPFVTRMGEREPRGFGLSSTTMRNFNINRERLGMSGRIEVRLSPNHEIYASISKNQFDDTIKQHTFGAVQAQTASQFYSGTYKFYTQEIARLLGHDVTAPDNVRRLAQSGVFNVYYDEAMALGEIVYDPELRLFTVAGKWPFTLNREYTHQLRKDTIDTYQIGGKHRLPWDVRVEWKAYASEAEQDSVWQYLRFRTSSDTAGEPRAGPDYANPYIRDLALTPAALRKELFTAPATLQGNTTVRRLNYTSSLDERKGGDIDLSKSFDVGSSNWTTRIGGAIDKREKEYAINNNWYGLRGADVIQSRWPGGDIKMSDPLFDGGQFIDFYKNFGPDMLFGPSFNEAGALAFLANATDYGITRWTQTPTNVADNVISLVNSNYAATEDTSALYLQQDIKWRKWTIIFGFRYEKTDNSFTSLEIITRNPALYDPPYRVRYITPAIWRNLAAGPLGYDAFTTKKTNERDYDHILPALHLIRNIGENAMVRGSITKTLGRPLFSDLIPRAIPSISDVAFEPNMRLPAFDLMPMESVNYDISLDYYMKPVGLLSVGLFFKDLDGPIYDEVRIGVGPNEETLHWEWMYNQDRNSSWVEGGVIHNVQSYTFSQKRNAGKGEVYGIELTFDRKLQFLPGFLNGFGINSNVAFFESSARLADDDRERSSEKVSMFGQPDWTGNLSLYYEKYGLFARLSYNVRGRYLDSITAGGTTILELEEMGRPASSMDIWVERLDRLDFTMRYKLTPRFQVFFEAINLTNEGELKTRNGMTYIPHSLQYIERTFTLGVKWNL